MKLILSMYSRINKEEKKKFLFIFIFTILIIFLELFSLALFLPIINLILNNSLDLTFIDFTFFDNLSRNNQIFFSLLFLLLVFIIKNIFYGFLIYFKRKFLANIEVDFASRIFLSYLNQSYSFHLKVNKANIMRNLGIVNEYVVIIDNLFNAFLEFLILFGIFFIIFLKDFQVGLFITVLSLLFTIIVFNFFKKRLKKYGELRNIFDQDVLNNYLDTFSSVRDIILQKKQNFFLKHYKKNISKLASINVKSSTVTEIPRLLIEVTVVFCVSSLVYFLFLNNQNTSETLVTLTFVTALMFRAAPSVSRINYQLNNLSFKLDIIKRTDNLIDSFSKNLNYSNKEKSLENDFHFENLDLKKVNFKYKDEEKNIIFENLDFQIKKNQAIGIIGSSGSGKSTLIDLITCMLKPNSGEVFINNEKLNNSQIESWQSKISCISQKNYLLNSTIKDNIAFGEDENEIDYSKINECLKLSKLKDFVDSNKKGANFYIGEDGKNLSGGQRQRIVLARALYRESEVLIFDEATSALDPKTEKEIMFDIKKNFHGKKTIIISTHKHNLLDFCDNIYNVEDFK